MHFGGVLGGCLLTLREKLMSLRRKRHQQVDQREQTVGQSLPDIVPHGEGCCQKSPDELSPSAVSTLKKEAPILTILGTTFSKQSFHLAFGDSEGRCETQAQVQT